MFQGWFNRFGSPIQDELLKKEINLFLEVKKVMGQKLSALKEIFGVMENHENKSDNSEIVRKSESDWADINSSGEGENAAHLSLDTCISNGNSAQPDAVDDHFESIYGVCSEGAKSEEGNSNIVHNKQCLYSVQSACIKKPECICQEEQESARTLSLISGKRSRPKPLQQAKDISNLSGKKKRNHWVLKFNCARIKGAGTCGNIGMETDIPETNIGCESCVCTGYRRTEDHTLGAGVGFDTLSQQQRHREFCTSSDSSNDDIHIASSVSASSSAEYLIDMSKFNPEDYPIEDCDERARLERAREIAEGVEPPPGFLPSGHIQMSIDEFTALFQSRFHPAAFSALSHVDVSLTPAVQRGVHTQVDYIHCLVPDLLQITSCSFYWGKMDRYEAERLLEGRPEGTFLLRDSAQEEYLFSVSFRKYGRSLHARIEQWNHHFSFDSHDPGVFASPTVCGLIEHYKDPSCCMFFEPMLTIPLHRNFTFPLQHLCRAVVCSRVTYDGVNKLNLPKSLKLYLKEYHYKQRVRVRRFDLEQ